MPTVTVNGANGQSFPVTYTTNDAFAAATVLAGTINNIVASPGVSTQVLTAPGAVTPPSGTYGELVVTSSGTPFLAASGPDLIVVVNGTAPASVAGSGLSNVSVIAGSGGLTFNAGTSSIGVNPTGVVVVAGDGNNLLGTATGTGGSATFVTASGNDTITAVAGTNTVFAGAGSNTILTGTAFDTIFTEGTDTIFGDTIPGAGGVAQVIGSGTSSDLVFAFGSKVAFDSGTSTSASTVFGGTGSDTVFSSIGGGSFFAGTGGNSSLVGGSGSVTLVGGASGDQLFSQPGAVTTGSAFLVAGAGNETISAVSDSRGAKEFAGFNTTINGAAVVANTVIFGGAGNDTIVAGTGNATLSSGGGSDSFLFANGRAGGSDVILGFTGADTIGLSGYTAPSTVPGLTGPGIAGVTVAGGNTTITLSDNTKITISNFTSLSNSNIIG